MRTVGEWTLLAQCVLRIGIPYLGIRIARCRRLWYLAAPEVVDFGPIRTESGEIINKLSDDGLGCPFDPPLIGLGLGCKSQWVTC